MNFAFVLIVWVNTFTDNISNNQKDIIGAWNSDNGILILTGGFFSYTEFTATEFKFTKGGSWLEENSTITFKYEYHTKDTSKIGTELRLQVEAQSKSLKMGNQNYTRLDDGTPGQPSGTWLFHNRIRVGKLGNPRPADNPRKTMKILSGTRFQWIAYNVKTKSFSGTGGGTYTTKDGKYTENIDFFSRDNSRTGASLEFEYEIKEDEWHHQGTSSKGDPIYEIWKLREGVK